MKLAVDDFKFGHENTSFLFWSFDLVNVLHPTARQNPVVGYRVILILWCK